MRTGFAVSIAGHVLLLAWGLFQLPAAKPFEVAEIDALPVDLVPIADVSQIAEGTKTAPLRDTASQAKVETPAPRPDSQRAGAAPTDQDTPITEKATDTAAAPEATPPPPPPPPPKAEKPPEPKPPEPKPPEPKPPEPTPPEPTPDPAPPTPEPPAPKPPEPAPAPEKPAEAAKPTADVGELAAAPEKPAEEAKPAPASAVKPTAKPRPPKPTEVAAADDAPAKPAPDGKSDQKKPSDKRPDKPSKPAEKEFDPNEMAALLNKVDPSGGGAKASSKDPSLGSEKRTGPVAKMTQNELEALRAKIQSCWTPPIGGDAGGAMVVPVRIELNPDGSLAGEPVAKQVPPGPFGTVLAESALRAVRRCAPYGDVLPPEKYDSWQIVNINFDPRDMF
ncbi:hypothetical protein [Oharaeibacter diazotrophicus]|uniref:Cell division and transport-associated protein TolA n=1 Tax=Oharaeibacter diazotrophicus TaxID=1920512 RepID=A0A4R6RFR5_9HYPH|nr:hypothetical protein [Oharaeibacter diazotrophicus]TDP85092.1 cell division and transport-associated protein TolA [Oharaeibacter diazotrophicus]BBE74063.1 hypothetical protein OHA_1_03689 [Pleomorphomonas sp. SM30]GLS76249.1 hypothetical protein GCM10007904_15840 [Oharaeibacter diazotrophicus]